MAPECDETVDTRNNQAAAALVDPGGSRRLALKPAIVARSDARFSPCGHYRYWLSRAWGEAGDTPKVLWLMLNPSTADLTVNDPTVHRCQNYAWRWGYAGYTVVNIFALRATDKKQLARADDPVGPENDERIKQALIDTCAAGGIVVCGWGASAPKRGRVVRTMIAELRCPVHALDWSQSGAPKHPLYLRRDLRPQPWEPLGLA